MGVLLDLLFPPKCVFCGKLLRRTEREICLNCLHTLPERDRGKRTPGAGVCIAPLYYEGTVSESVRRFKFGGMTAYAAVYGKLLAAKIGKTDAELVTWIPVSRLRRFGRTYDQTELLAKETAKCLRKPCVSVLRKKHTKKQSQSGAYAARKANIAGAFSVTDTEAIRGKRFLLIDDICTTGATLSEAVRVLKLAGAEQVICAVFAATREK